MRKPQTVQKKFHVKRGDVVVVISGSHRGKQGKILEMLRKKSRAIVEGINMVKRHERKSQEHPNGRIVEREASLHISNLMLLSRFEEKKARRTAKAKA